MDERLFRRVKGSVSLFGAFGVAGGDDETAKIQAAIDEAEKAGGVVYFPAGTYEITLNASNNGLEIRASDVGLYLDVGAVVKLADNQISGAGQGRLIDIGDGSTAISNIHIWGPGWLDWNNASNSTTAGVSTSPLIRVNSLVTDVHISTGFRSSGATGAPANGDSIFLNGSSGNEIQRVTVDNCRFDDVAEAVTWQHATDVRVTNNTINNVSQDAIEPADGASGFVISNNIITDVEQSAIDLFRSASRGVVSNNVLYDTAKSGTAAFLIGADAGNNSGTDITIIGNTIDTTGDTAIGISFRNTGTTDPQRINLVNNTIRSTGSHGINVAGSLTNILIMGNYVSNAGKGAAEDSYGIQVSSGGSKVDVIGNVVEKASSHGFFLQSGTGAVVGNIARNNDVGGTANRTGIRVQGTNHVVVGNMAYDDDAGDQINGFDFLSGGIGDVIVVGNLAFGNATADAKVSSGAISTLGNLEPDSGTQAAAANTATLANAPKAGDPDAYIKIDHDGTEYYVPAWTPP